mgnify:CR=1 FL=1
MNQILITEKLYITPELKRKKKLYKLDFIISVFLLCLLVGYYVYAEYDRNKGEQMSQEILQNMVIADTNSDVFSYDDTTVRVDDDKIVVILDGENNPAISTEKLQAQVEQNRENIINQNTSVTSTGDTVTKIAIVNIPSINITYPVLSTYNEELLKTSPCKYWGPDPNEVGNFCIVAHNYRNAKFFSKVPELENGDIVEITDLNNRTIQYVVYDKYVVREDDRTCSSQKTDGRKEVTLITCTDDSENRVVVKATEKTS